MRAEVSSGRPRIADDSGRRSFALAVRLENLPSKGETCAGAAFDRAVEALRCGDVIVYPTETFYGLGANPFVAEGLARLFAIKAREAGKPVALIASDSAMAFALARQIPPAAYRLAAAFWPGPLTLVLVARTGMPAALIGSDGGVGVRVSSHPVARSLSSAIDAPITATSANLAGAPPAVTIAEAQSVFGAKVKVYLEGGTMAAGAPSTLVAFDGGRPRILREGAIPEARLLAAL